jgi:hypothetical protein
MGARGLLLLLADSDREFEFLYPKLTIPVKVIITLTGIFFKLLLKAHILFIEISSLNRLCLITKLDRFSAQYQLVNAEY